MLVYVQVGDTGPPHLRHFTILARVGHLTRQATATTKKAARQLAADQLYSYLRENLARLTKDFVEVSAAAHVTSRKSRARCHLARAFSQLGQSYSYHHTTLGSREKIRPKPVI